MPSLLKSVWELPTPIGLRTNLWEDNRHRGGTPQNLCWLVAIDDIRAGTRMTITINGEPEPDVDGADAIRAWTEQHLGLLLGETRRLIHDALG